MCIRDRSNVVAKMREMCAAFDARARAIGIVQPPGGSSNRQKMDQLESLATEVSGRYNSQFRSDRTLLNNEILRRLDRKAAVAVIRVPLFDAETGTPLSFSTLIGPTGFGTMDMAMMQMAADETEQLAKLLPPK